MDIFAAETALIDKLRRPAGKLTAPRLSGRRQRVELVSNERLAKK